MRALLLAIVGLCALASTASAATVTVVNREVRYVAAPGEQNNLLVAYAADALSITVTDPGATIQAQGSCTSLTTHSARCSVAGVFLQETRAELGDGNDRAETTRPGPNVIGGIDAFGGPGNDTLIGSPTIDRLDGGGGSDVLLGNDGGDVISDGDTTTLDADTMDGGSGAFDRISYAQRTSRVVVDLTDDGPDGAPGENDIVRGFEDATGGSGNDRLVGNGADNDLDGGAGRNRLFGRGGDDIMRRATGSFVGCGAGDDALTRPRAKTRIPRGCERLHLRLKRGTSADFGGIVRPTPRREDGRLGTDVTCPDFDGVPVSCATQIKVRRRSNGRLLAQGRLGEAGELDRQRFLRLRLTPLGRRLRGNGNLELARMTIRGDIAPRTSWTIGF